MARRLTRLAPYGASGRHLLIRAAVGAAEVTGALSGIGASTHTGVATIVCQATFDGLSETAQSSGSFSSTSTFTGVGSAVISGLGALHSQTTLAGVGGSLVATTGTLTGTVTLNGVSTAVRYTRLGPHGVSSRRFPHISQVTGEHRFWNVVDTLGLGLEISEFFDFQFALGDELGITFNEVAVFSGTSGNFASTVTFSGVGISTAATTGSLASTVTFSGAGANVLTVSGTGSLSSVITMAAQGGTVGTVFGVGVGAFSSATSLTAIGSWFHEGPLNAFSAVVFTGIGESIATGDSAMASTVTFTADSTVFVVGAGALSSTSTLSASSLATKEATGNLTSSVTFQGRAIFSAVDTAAVSARYEILTNTMRLELINGPSMKLEIV